MRSMKKLITTITLALLTFTASAQYRFVIYPATIATNAAIAPSNYATINQTFDVASAPSAILQLAFKLTALTNSTPATNSIVTVWEQSLDGTRFTNRFSFSIYANNSTNEVWDFTNSATSLPWLKLLWITNNTSATLTNHSVKIGKRS